MPDKSLIRRTTNCRNEAIQVSIELIPIQEVWRLFIKYYISLDPRQDHSRPFWVYLFNILWLTILSVYNATHIYEFTRWKNCVMFSFYPCSFKWGEVCTNVSSKFTSRTFSPKTTGFISLVYAGDTLTSTAVPGGPLAQKAKIKRGEAVLMWLPTGTSAAATRHVTLSSST